MDRGLDSFGDSTKKVVYWNFQEQSRMSREDIVEHMPAFETLLKKMFGASASSIEKKIMVQITDDLGTKSGTFDSDLSSFVVKAKRDFMKRES